MITRFASQASTARFKTFNFQPTPATQPKASPSATAPKVPRRPPLAPFQRARLRAKIATITCSDPWTELAANAAEKYGIHPATENVFSHLAQRGIYPPKPDPGPHNLPRTGAVRMRRCHACGRIVPPNNLATFKLVRLCDDCRIEPETDPDEIDQKPTCARTPGVHLRVLMEGLTDGEVKQNDAREQLHRIGLTDPQITVLSLLCTGHSTRRIAEINNWSQTYACKLLLAAQRKLRRSGLIVPQLLDQGPTPRPINIDPVKLDCMSDHVR